MAMLQRPVVCDPRCARQNCFETFCVSLEHTHLVFFYRHGVLDIVTARILLRSLVKKTLWPQEPVLESRLNTRPRFSRDGYCSPCWRFRRDANETSSPPFVLVLGRFGFVVKSYFLGKWKKLGGVLRSRGGEHHGHVAGLPREGSGLALRNSAVPPDAVCGVGRMRTIS